MSSKDLRSSHITSHSTTCASVRSERILNRRHFVDRRISSQGGRMGILYLCLEVLGLVPYLREGSFGTRTFLIGRTTFTRVNQSQLIHVSVTIHGTIPNVISVIFTSCQPIVSTGLPRRWRRFAHLRLSSVVTTHGRSTSMTTRGSGSVSRCLKHGESNDWPFQKDACFGEQAL